MITSVLPVRANGQSIHVRAIGTSVSAVTFVDNAVNSSIFVLDEEDRRTVQRKFSARRILSFAGWGGGEVCVSPVHANRI